MCSLKNDYFAYVDRACYGKKREESFIPRVYFKKIEKASERARERERERELYQRANIPIARGKYYRR